MNPERICYGCFMEKEPGIPCPNCGFDENEEQPYLALPLGTILNGRYLVGKVLGIGGFGITYLGYDLTLEIKVAIKEYMPSALATRNSDRYTVALTGRVEEDYQYGMERFLDEAKILAKLQNTQHIVSVQNYFKENATAYFVMEYVDGMSLKSYLSKHGEKISYEEALTILKPVMEALIEVHALHLLHRDISPDNIYITSSGDSRLLDFGAARFAFGDGKSVSVILKHGYAPEEQYSSHGNQGPWTDVYAMGATMYRCITGQLPPDSMERLHGDGLKKPSELGIFLPENVENAILKALSVQIEDRFPNMETFIRALDGPVSVQDQVAASINQRTQTTMYGQNTTIAADSEKAKKPSPFAGILSYIKANPVIAGVVGGGILLIIVVLIIFSVVRSGKNKSTPVSSGSNLGNNTTIVTPQDTNIAVDETEIPENTEAPKVTETTPEMTTYDLGILNATIDVPSTYNTSDDEIIFWNGDKSFLMIDFCWTMDIPIYSMSDVENGREEIAAEIVRDSDIEEYSFLTAGPDQVGNRDAYQICLQAKNSDGDTAEMIIMAVDSDLAFGCYFLIGTYYQGDDVSKSELYEIIHTFDVKGAVDVMYTKYYAERAGVQVIIDDALAQGGVSDMEMDLGDSKAHEIMIFPDQAAAEAGVGNINSSSAGGVEAGFASEWGLATPQDVIDYNYSLVSGAGGTAYETYTVHSGGVDWLVQDYEVQSYGYSYASAVIDGQCYLVGCMFNDSNRDTVVTLYNQVMSTVRPWK